MNYYEHHLGDYLRDTAHLSMIEDGAYRRLLDAYYIRERPLPADPREVYRLARAQSKQDREAVDVVLREFFHQTPDGWEHGRCDREIARFRDKQDKARRSAEVRWSAKREACERNANASSEDMRTHCEGNAPRARPQTPDTNTSTSLRSVEGARAKRLPPNWCPSDADWGTACIALHTSGAQRELAKFRDYWAAKSGAGGVKLDWDATWRNWIRKAGEYAESRGTGGATAGRKSAVDRVREANREALEGSGDALAADDGDLRAPLDQRARRDADGVVVDGAFRVVG